MSAHHASTNATVEAGSVPKSAVTQDYINAMDGSFVHPATANCPHCTAQDDRDTTPWFLKSQRPVLLPEHPAFAMADGEFEAFIKSEVSGRQTTGPDVEMKLDVAATIISDTGTLDFPSATSETVNPPKTETAAAAEPVEPAAPANPNPFMNALLGQGQQPNDPPNLERKMLTENGDVAFRATSPLVDLFYELEDVLSGPRLDELLRSAWGVDPSVTLKIIFNARSIHLGKSSKKVFYRCAGWLAQNHPATLVTNLHWLNRPVIQKKVEKKPTDDEEEAPVVVDEAMLLDESDPAFHDVRNGVSHGYWKDLLNILALAANDKLSPLADPSTVLNIDERKNKVISAVHEEIARERRHALRDDRHQVVLDKFANDPFYRVLHIAVARLFAAQLKLDLARLRSDDAKARRQISLCAKWAPTTARFHDKHTFVVSSIAELMHPHSALQEHGNGNLEEAMEGGGGRDRETYLRYTRESYRQDVSALRKYLEVVERDLSANTLSNIKYERVPSVAMKNYAGIFAAKDTERFDEYVSKVAGGTARISGAVLLPSTLIKAVREGVRAAVHTHHPPPSANKKRRKGKGSGGGVVADAVARRVAEMEAKVVDGQWKALVQRIKDSGTMQATIAVCDVSGSMGHPEFKDGTTPMDSAIGLSLLVAEVGAPPFQGAFITFSSRPTVERVDLSSTLREKWEKMSRASWGMSTDFVAVFEKLILPLAVKNEVKQEDMVKRVIVFSDMQFNYAASEPGRWSSSYERVQAAYRQAGYEMPELVFWNLAGGRAGYGSQGGSSYHGGDPTAPKPVDADTPGTAMVSGYSQGMLKVFLDGGVFDDESAEEEEEGKDEEMTEVVKTGEGEEDVVEKETTPKKKQKTDPLDTVLKAVGHKAFAMLRVVD